MWDCQVPCMGRNLPSSCSATTKCQSTLQLPHDRVWPELLLTNNATGDPVTALPSVRACKIPAQKASKRAFSHAHGATFVT